MKLIDLTGKIFGKLTVIERCENTKAGQSRWLCQCECGRQTKVSASNLKSREVKSCGCLSVKHGLRHTRLNRVWSGMIQRCCNPKSAQYKNYGGRGITVFEEWKNDFKLFYDWAMTNGYQNGLTIDRINVNGNYEPSNCRWATPKEQANNRRDNVKITHNGRTQTIAEWETEYGFKPSVIGKRLRKGLPVEDVLNPRLMPSSKARFVTYNGETKTLKERASFLGIKYHTLISRITTNGWSIEKAFNYKRDRRGSCQV